MSSLFAPIMMVIQTGSTMQILFGSDTGWNPQRRDDGSVPFLSIVRRHRSHVALGAITLVTALLISPSLAAWMSPTIAGLLLAIPLSWASSKLTAGLVLKRAALLLTPEETTPPPIAERSNRIAAELSTTGHDNDDGIAALHADPDFRVFHESILPKVEPHVRGVIDPDRAVAEAKLNDAQSIEELIRWLKPRERMVVLHDRALIDMLVRLPTECERTADQPAGERETTGVQ
jgi:membrane glycosyltransferase